MSCYAQMISVESPEVYCDCDISGDCCSNIVKPVTDIDLNVPKIDCCILRGTITVNGTKLQGVLVTATSKSNYEVYGGVTNSEGQYAIVVPCGQSYVVEGFYSCTPCIPEFSNEIEDNIEDEEEVE